jgi:hypothetical protein
MKSWTRKRIENPKARETELGNLVKVRPIIAQMGGRVEALCRNDPGDGSAASVFSGISRSREMIAVHPYFLKLFGCMIAPREL